MEEVPQILRKFKFTIVFCFVMTAGMAVLSGRNELESVRRVNEAIEGVIESLDKAKISMRVGSAESRF